jgi:hypothetical protein
MSDPVIAMIVPLSGGHPDQGLPPQSPGAPTHPWVPPSPGSPTHPIGGGGGQPSHPIVGYPDQGLPGGGVVGSPEHPIVIPPMPPPVVGHPIPPAIWPGVPIHPGTPEHPITLPPGSVWPPLPPSITGEALILVWVVSVGYRWLVVDASLDVDNELPATPEPK